MARKAFAANVTSASFVQREVAAKSTEGLYVGTIHELSVNIKYEGDNVCIQKFGRWARYN